MATVMSSRSRPATSALVLAGAVLAVVLLSAHLGEAAAYYEKLGPYYQHDTVSRPNFTDIITVRGYSRTEGFGALSIFDDPITVTPDINSKTVGRVQGFQAVVALDESSVLMTQTVHLPGGTLTFTGQFSMLSKADSRLHCVGGTGEFEGVVHGFFETELYQINEYTIDAILKVTINYHKEEKYW